MKHNSFIIVLNLFLVTSSYSLTCDRTPANVIDIPKPNEGRYVIEILGTPESYSPGQIYTIVLKSNPQNPVTNYFKQFTVIVEAQNPQAAYQNFLTGDLKPVDHSIARFTPRCPNAIVQVNELPKSHVEILWTAPPEGNGRVAIKATVYESTDTWFTDDGGLTKLIDEEEEHKDVQPAVLDECCACKEAKYEIAFEGMWTRNTHPVDYPKNMWTTKLGQLIGASHKHSTAFWNYDSEASDGLKLLAEEGDTTQLENELKQLVKDDSIRTIIKARELSYPNITGVSYTVFRVDKEHHLISLVSKITPSPDWIVGVANLELCTPDCTWVSTRTLNLYPWDVGTDDGTSYNSPDLPSDPRKPTKQITADMEDYPFHSADEAIKPIGQLRVTRQKLYENVCNNTESEQEDGSCPTTDWSSWSTCSNTCGNSVKTRDRQLVNSDRASECAETELQETVPCEEEEAPTSDCTDSKCSNNVTWTEWSPCSVTCNTGSKTRTGIPLLDETSDNENKEDEESPPCTETVECEMPACEEETTYSEIGSFRGESYILTQEADGPVVDCRVSAWSAWGSCSATKPCGRGMQYKERHIEVHPQNGGKSCPSRLRRGKSCKVPCSDGETKRRKSTIVDCKMSEWSTWTPCSNNCGSSAVQIRTRTVEVEPKNGGRPCGPRVDKKKCTLPYSCGDQELLFLNKY